MTARDMLLGLIIIFAWGFNFVVIRWGLDAMTPMMLGGTRFLVLALIGSFFFARPKTPLKWCFLYALSLNFGQFGLLFSAMIFGMPAGLASLVLQSQAIFTLLFSVLLLKEVVRPYQIVAIAIACGGLTLIGAAGKDTSMTMLGFVLTLAAASSWAMGNIANKMIYQKGYQADLSLIVWSAWLAAIPFFISAYFIDGPQQMWSNLIHINGSTLAILGYLAVVATLAGYGLWSFLMSRYRAGTVAPLSLGVPVVGLTSAALVLEESISPQQWLGIIVVLLGLILNTFGGRLRHRQKTIS
ncbi:putative amino-acid metabolite efflux pump [Marinomonas aquimarina]|uniref:Putative amino-acid metabolite efflux pump n=1 Tax=Marinomonas aquimarina TaxID=295068 RepID=A0A1A8TPP9_9GAMM|nr:EamA family transporter [Marinomonas aquimarina]SBS36238.1 putative amino-acid metabolite efflux pump [Marinomonas aquimarina]